jgi:hypothetical protein
MKIGFEYGATVFFALLLLARSDQRWRSTLVKDELMSCFEANS